MRLTPRKATHISAAPETNGVTEGATDERVAQGSRTCKVAQLVDGPGRLVERSMNRMFGKGYAGGGDHQFWPSGWTVFSSSLVREPDLRVG